MKKANKYRVTLTIIVSLLFFISIIVLTNDYFDDIESRNTILMSLLLCQFGIIIYTLMFYNNKNKK